MIKMIAQSKNAEEFWSVKNPGQWRGLKADGVRTAGLSCPDCGQVASLSHHKIDQDGIVTPSVVCPTEGCKFHEWIKLDGWSGVAKG